MLKNENYIGLSPLLTSDTSLRVLRAVCCVMGKPLDASGNRSAASLFRRAAESPRRCLAPSHAARIVLRPVPETGDGDGDGDAVMRHDATSVTCVTSRSPFMSVSGTGSNLVIL